MAIQDSRLLFVFKIIIIIIICFILIRKKFFYVIAISSRDRQDVFKTSWKTRNCTSTKTKNCYSEDVFKTSWTPTNVFWAIIPC